VGFEGSGWNSFTFGMWIITQKFVSRYGKQLKYICETAVEEIQQR
jgi:hypothetical protein